MITAMRPTTRLISLVLGILATALTVEAQPSTTTGPATRPAIKVFTPKGYVRLEVGGRAYICLPTDQGWVNEGARRVKAGIGPATKPADLLEHIAARRDLFVATMLKDLPTLKPSQVDEVLDQRIIPGLKQLSFIRPSMVYIVSPAEHLKQALREGWTDPRFRYNAVSDTLDFDRSVSLATDGPADESAVAAIFNTTDTTDQRTSALAQYITDSESQVQLQIASRATTLALVNIADFIARQAMTDLPRTEDQVWMATGLSNVLAARYVSTIHGSPWVQFIEALITSPQATPVNAAGLDLLNPTPIAALKDEFVPAHLDGRRRKSIAVMYVWLKDAGDAKLMPTIEAVERAKPADGVTLVRVIKDISGIDLTESLKPR